jgi:hypothetical protein
MKSLLSFILTNYQWQNVRPITACCNGAYSFYAVVSNFSNEVDIPKQHL